MSNLIPLDDAARMLGLSVDKLSEMRSNSEIFGYKDGASWKFKMQELERVADEFGLTISPGETGDPAADATDAVSDAVKQDDDDFDLTLDNDQEDSELSFDLSDSADIILEDDESSAEISLVDDGDEQKLSGEDDFAIADDESSIDLDAPVASEEPAELSFGTSDIKLAEGSGENLLDDEEPGRGDPSTGKLLDDEDDELVLSEDDLFEDELKIEESDEDSLDLSSDFESSDDAMIESDSSADSEVLEVSEDSDFSLSDSGLVELAEESDDMIVLDEPADLEDATQLGDDDFNLTPVEEAMDVDDGSQVIALDDADMYDDASATLLSPSDEMEAAPMLTDDAMSVDDFGGFDAGAMGMAPGSIPGAAGSLPESPYTSWQIASLGLVAALLGFGGIIAYDLARNLWLPEDQIITGGLLPSIVSLFGG